MFRKLTNLLLTLSLASTVAAGMPMHSTGDESGMMDCCKKAQEQSKSPQVAAARLCCAMNCDEPAPTNGNPGQSFSRTGLEPSQLLAAALPIAANHKWTHPRYVKSVSTSSDPAYILNLALLI